MAGRFSCEGARDDCADGRKGVDDIGARSAVSLLLLLLEALLELEGCEDDA